MAIEVVMPALGLTVEKGVIIQWLKMEGDPVKKGEPLFEVEADKVTTEVESPASGILSKILVPVDVEVPILTVVGIITEAGEDLPAKYSAPEAFTQPAGVDTTMEAKGSTPSPLESSDTVERGGPIRAVPAARKLAREKGLDLLTITGTGPEGIILVRDVATTVASLPGPTARATPLARKIAETEGIPLGEISGTGVKGRIMRADVDRVIDESATPGQEQVIPMSPMRRVIARRMSGSAFTSPHIYFFADVWMDPLLDFRKDILGDFEKRFGLRPSVNDFLIKAVALNLLEFPMLNAVLKDENIHLLPNIHVGLAVALPEGLIVPAVAYADQAGLSEIVRQRMDLVQRALEGKSTRDELERGTFTISSLAQYDITHFTAILNPPQSGILSVAKAREVLVMMEGEVKVRRVSTFGLGVDHRIIDGAVAADFLQNLKWKLERPLFTFLDL
jgi:pyruvate dehydrogenase E2 component (dihydrolipoamide acetyltransferase)